MTTMPPQVTDPSTPTSLTAAQFHPDNLVLGPGTWDLKERLIVANFQVGFLLAFLVLHLSFKRM